MKNNELRWQSLNSEYVLDTKWLKVKKEVVRLPDGKILDDFYTVEGNDLIAIFAVDNENNVLLVRQYRHAVGGVTIDLPGGGVEMGEEPVEAAKRELVEETGMLAGHLERLLTYYPDSGKTICTKHIFLATSLTKDMSSTHNQDESEDIRLMRIPLTELMQRARDGEFKEATLYLGVSAYSYWKDRRDKAGS